MRTIAIISQKGGVGKSTIAVHLATAADFAGHRARIIDLDPQANAAAWGDWRQAKSPTVVSGQSARLPFMLAEAREAGADVVFIDTAPNADRASLDAAKASDLVLIPCRPARFDIAAIETTLGVAELARKPSFIVLNMIPTVGGGGERAAAGLQGSGLSVAPIMLGHRAAYAHGVIDGRTAQEFDPACKAAQEIGRLYEWMCGMMGLPALGSSQLRAA